MISAVEALRLPIAQLTQDERESADSLAGAIEAHIRLKMSYAGCQYDAYETRANVVADVALRLRQEGWQVRCQPLFEQSRLGMGQGHYGFQFVLVPTDEAYQAALARGQA